MIKQERRKATERSILEAIEVLLIEQGYRGLGVNAIARRAKVSKLLIYRYFGDVDGAVHALMRDRDYWSVLEGRGGMSEENIKEMPPDKQLTAMLKGQIRSLRNQPAIQEIRRWELIENNQLTDELANKREAASLRFLEQMGQGSKNDVPAAAALLLAASLFLVLRTRTSPHYFGIDLRSDEGWKRIEDALEHLAAGVFEDTDRRQEHSVPAAVSRDDKLSVPDEDDEL